MTTERYICDKALKFEHYLALSTSLFTPHFSFPRLQLERPADNYVSPFAGKPWYFGHMSRRSCDNMLMEVGEEGDFLVRDSESKVFVHLS